MHGPAHVVRPLDEAHALALLPVQPRVEEHARVRPPPEQPLVVLLFPGDVCLFFAEPARRDGQDVVVQRCCGGGELGDKDAVR